MQNVLVLRHVAWEDLGRLEAVFEAEGRHVRYFDVGVDAFADIYPLDSGLVVVLGGPISIVNVARSAPLRTEVAWLRARLLEGLPTLGICLGAQLMAAALGGRSGHTVAEPARDDRHSVAAAHHDAARSDQPGAVMARADAAPCNDPGAAIADALPDTLPDALTDVLSEAVSRQFIACGAPLLQWHGDSAGLPVEALHRAFWEDWQASAQHTGWAVPQRDGALARHRPSA